MIEMILMTIAVPAIAGGAVLLIGLGVQIGMQQFGIGRSHSDDQPATDRSAWPLRLAGALGVTLAIMISFRYLEGEWPVPPHTRWHWVFLMTMAAGAIGAVNAMIPAGRGPTWRRTAVVAAVLGVAGMILLRPLPPIDDGTAVWPDWLWKIGFGGGVVVSWLGLEAVSRREGAAWTLLGVIVAFTAASIVIIEARFAKPSQLAGAVAATCGLAWAISLALTMTGRRMPMCGGMTAPLAMALPALLIFGWFYNVTDVPATSFVLVALTPLALLPMAVTPWRRAAGWRGWPLRFAMIVILPAIAIALTMLMKEPPPEPSGYEW